MSDPNAPSWLSDDVGTTGVPADTLDAVPVSADSSAGTVNVNSSATNASQLEQDAADEAALPGIILSMRLANMGAAVSLMTCSVSWTAVVYACVCVNSGRNEKRHIAHSGLAIDFRFSC